MNHPGCPCLCCRCRLYPSALARGFPRVLWRGPRPRHEPSTGRPHAPARTSGPIFHQLSPADMWPPPPDGRGAHAEALQTARVRTPIIVPRLARSPEALPVGLGPPRAHISPAGDSISFIPC